ncbi:hypothetical protein HDU96_007854 [Phlyctochytrium bullatum]|nr:hypothetical protein HDU96_007854 [Phlyctochytrium bullatum]
MSHTSSAVSIGSEKGGGAQIVSSATSSLANHLASLAESVKAGAERRKGLSAVRANSKLFQKLPHAKLSSFNGGQASLEKGAAGVNVSTENKDGGLGLPTFATLKCELAIKSTAEMAFSYLMNQLGHFPPFGENTGVSRVSTIWNEVEEVKRILSLRKRYQNNMFDEDTKGPLSFTPQEIRRFLRLYIFDGRVIVGLLEQPTWAYSSEDDFFEGQGEPSDPALTLILRDATGKYSWTTKLKYTEDAGRTVHAFPSNQPSPSATSSNLAAG